jgi:hypothetical protein
MFSSCRRETEQMNRILWDESMRLGKLHVRFTESAKLKEAIEASLRWLGYGG